MSLQVSLSATPASVCTLKELKHAYIQAEQLFNESVQNFRGLMSSCQSQVSGSKSTSDSLVNYKILGTSGATQEQGLAALKIVHHNAKLAKLSAQVLERLCDLVHARLSLFNALHESHYQGLVVGMSGGADSTLALVLACSMRNKYGYQALAIHCIHRLDPDDDIWLVNNEQLCARLQVELRTPVLNIVYGKGVSPEDSSRNERYKALIANTQAGQDCLVLGHQADDQVESFLLSLKRGSGPHGLRGMRFLVQDERGLLLRPLLELHKIEIEQILTDLGFEYVFDLSNHYLKFERNFMRLKVLPKLRERFVGIDRSILRTQALCSAEHDLAERYIQEQLPRYLKALPLGPQDSIKRKEQAVDTLIAPLQSRDCSKELIGYCFDFKGLDLSDRNLVLMLLRAFYSKLLKTNVDYNVIERSYELMVKEHDKNGLIELNLPVSALKGYTDQLTTSTSTLVASTFLHYLQVYIKELETSSSPEASSYELTLGKSLERGAYRYQLVALEDVHQVLPIRACFALRAGEHKVMLDFNKTGSLKLKPHSRNHSRELKKLFLEYQIAPWQRATQPLVKDSQGQILSLGNIFACSIEQIAEPLCYYYLKIERICF